MTNYTTSAGVQKVSITIGNGSTSNTATITATGSGAYILWSGQTTSFTGTTANKASARVALTNSTTVTATRNTSDTSTVTVNAIIVDGDTTNLIKSVQTGTIVIASSGASNTATISSVTNNNTAIAYLGASSADASDAALGSNNAVLSLSGTTLTATRGISGTFALTVGYCVIEYQGTPLHSTVQNVAYNATINAASDTATITSVTTGNTYLVWGGFTGGGSSSTANSRSYGQLTNGTTVTISWDTSASIARQWNASVVEFNPGVLNQSVQRGTISLSSATSNTATITSVNATYAYANWLNNSAHSATSQDIVHFKQALTNGTTVTDTVNTSATGVGSYEVVEFPAFSGGGAVTIGFTGFGCGGIVNTTGSGTVGWASCG